MIIGTVSTALIQSSSTLSSIIVGLVAGAGILTLSRVYPFRLGVLVIYGVPLLREVPIRNAQALARMTRRRRSVALVYIVGVFFVVPLIAIGLSTL